MKTNISNIGGESTLTIEIDFNQIVNENFAEVCEVIANKGKFLKEMLAIFKEKPDVVSVIIQTLSNAQSNEDAANRLCEIIGMSKSTAHYILNMQLSDLTSLTEAGVKISLEQHKEIVEAIR
ncbi:MAG: hypothetical protein IK100_00670 [Muribaculaceae bacterium]|nr:hypothetical protein [Muribaculaceae bacterium]